MMFKERVKNITIRFLRTERNDQEGQNRDAGARSPRRGFSSSSPSLPRISTSNRHGPQSPPRPPRPARPKSPDLSMITPDSPTVLTRRVFRSPLSTPRRDPTHSSPPVSPPLSPVTDRAWFVPVPVLDKHVYPFEYQFGGTIGEGGFGKVLLALNIDTRDQYAIKVVAIRRMRSRRETSSIANEIKVLWRVSQSSSPFLARPARMREWYWQYRGNVHMVMILGLLALHDMGIIHHDVKPSNILIDGEGHCVLTDYGGSLFTSPDNLKRVPSRTSSHSHSTSSSSSSSSRNGHHHSPSTSTSSSHWRVRKEQIPIFTVRYAAPEVLRSGAGLDNPHSPVRGPEDPETRAYGTAIDFWSLGITLFELATGQEFFDDPDDDQVVYNIQRGRIDRQQLGLLGTYSGLRSFVSALLVYEPTRRLQGYEIKNHSYFAEFSQNEWISIQMKQRPPFSTNKQAPLNPRNTSYDFIERPGESLLDDANGDIVERWMRDSGVNIPHHRDSEYHVRHKKNARIGVPDEGPRRMGWKSGDAEGGSSHGHAVRGFGPYERDPNVAWIKSS